MKIRTKIVLLISLVVVLVTLAMGGFSSYTVRTELLAASHEKLASDLALGRAWLEQNDHGDWSVRDGELYKGQTLMSNNVAIIDKIAELTGDTVTLFVGDVSTATNVKLPDGKLAIGTKVLPDIAEKVLKQGQTFIGEADVVGTMSQTAYEPIKNAKGETVGIWYVGVANAPFDALISHFRNRLIVFGGVGLLVAIIVSAIVAELNARPLVRLAAVSNQVGEGDLRVQPLPESRSDEIGQLSRSINRMVHNLHDLIQSVNITAAQVAAASGELSASTEQTEQTTSQITSTIEEVASGAESQVLGAERSTLAIEELTSGIQRVTETSIAVSEASLQTAREAEQGNDSVQYAVEQMRTIHLAVNESAEGFKLLEQRSHEIEKIVEVITGIANQTNLLALNAAIEAARAGEHGKGFAIVADEVRKLAEQSGESAAQIAALIQAIQNEMSKAVGSMDLVTREVQSGTRVVHEAGEAFGRILGAARIVSDQLQDVTASAEEMTANSLQVAVTVEEMTGIARQAASNAENVAGASQQQLATIEEISASAESLNGMAVELRELVGKFKV